MLGGIIVIAAAACYFVLLLTGRRLTVRKYFVHSDKISQKVRIIQIADLHGNEFGVENERLLAHIRGLNPDLIVFTGDNVRDYLPVDGLENFLRKLCAICPVYWVSGNHELRHDTEKAQRQMMQKCGAQELNDRTVFIKDLCLCGVSDPWKDARQFNNRLAERAKSCAHARFSVLLSHRPEYAQKYAAHGFDLTLCGHAHGGQWRIPGLVNGVLAPNQGIFPRFAGGYYQLNNKSAMIVSRGLATQYIIPRIFNPTELVEVTLMPQNHKVEGELERK